MMKPTRRGEKIEKLYAWVSEDEDGGEGIIAVQLPGLPGFTPLVGADRARMESYRRFAELTMRQSRFPVVLKVFDKGIAIDRVQLSEPT